MVGSTHSSEIFREYQKLRKGSKCSIETQTDDSSNRSGYELELLRTKLHFQQTVANAEPGALSTCFTLRRICKS